MNNTTANAAYWNTWKYTKWYKLYEQEQFVTVLENSDALISQFSGDEIVSKFELLKANTLGNWKDYPLIKTHCNS
jgi:hypothetical protein